MVMKRTKEPWMRADDFGRSLPRGVGINLLVTDIAPTEEFLRLVLGANTSTPTRILRRSNCSARC